MFHKTKFLQINLDINSNYLQIQKDITNGESTCCSLFHSITKLMGITGVTGTSIVTANTLTLKVTMVRNIQ